MRRMTIPVIAVGAALLLGSPAVAVDPSPSAPATAAQGKKMCKLSDAKLGEVSGIVAAGTGYVAVNTTTGIDNVAASHQKIFVLTSACKVSRSQAYSGSGPLSPEDIVRAKDGTLWIADTGKLADRTNIALWKVPAAVSAPQIFRLSFPGGQKREIKALLVNGDGTPILVSFETDRTARLYTPSAALVANQTVELKEVGKIDILPTVTDNYLGGFGRKGFVGGAVSPDGSKVALRTLADAYEWDVTDGDVLAALKTEPRVTGLPRPAEQYSESLTYSADGSQFITAPLMAKAQDEETATLVGYTPTTKSYVPPPTTEKAGDSWLMKWLKNLSLDQAYGLLAGVGVIGLALVGLGVFGMVNGRKKRAKALAAAKKARKREELEDYDEFGPVADNSPTAVLAPVRGQGYDDHGYGGYDDRRAPQPGYQQPYAGGGYAEPGWNQPPPRQGWDDNNRAGY
ncbi:MAG: hypothetical protein HOV79_02405 [Hamadaea sp.]|nr:hypothetical protein [Hamadaea sp.]